MEQCFVVPRTIKAENYKKKTVRGKIEHETISANRNPEQGKNKDMEPKRVVG